MDCTDDPAPGERKEEEEEDGRTRFTGDRMQPESLGPRRQKPGDGFEAEEVLKAFPRAARSTQVPFPMEASGRWRAMGDFGLTC